MPSAYCARCAWLTRDLLAIAEFVLMSNNEQSFNATVSAFLSALVSCSHFLCLLFTLYFFEQINRDRDRDCFRNKQRFVLPLVLLARDAMHKRGLCRQAVSVCVSVTFVNCVKMNKDIFEIFSPRVAKPFSFFHAKRDGDIPTGTHVTGASNAGGVGKKRDSGRISGFAAYRSTVLSTVLVAKYEKQSRDGRRRASSTPRRPSSVVRTRRRRSVCDGLDAYAGDGGQTRPGHNPFGHNPVLMLP